MNQRVHRNSKYATTETEDAIRERQIARILSHDFIHVHVPKTAGSTLRNMLGTHQTTGHFSAPKIRELITVDEWNERLTFAFVRNPWDRMVSWFFFHQQTYNPPYRRFKSFKEWVMAGLPDYWGTDWIVAGQPSDPLVCSSFFTNAKGDVLVDFVGRFEQFAEDVEYICDALDMPMPQLSHDRRSSHDHYRTYYDDDMIQQVRKRCQEDVTRFGYEF